MEEGEEELLDLEGEEEELGNLGKGGKGGKGVGGLGVFCKAEMGWVGSFDGLVCLELFVLRGG